MGFPLVLSVHAERVAFGGRKYIGEDSFGRGVGSIEEAEAVLEAYAPRALASLHPVVRKDVYSGRFVARVRKPCRECGITGVKAGCKRKKCPACSGVGTTDVVDLFVSVT